MVCILFIFHPELTIQALRMFQCEEIDDGESRMRLHLEFDCYSVDHMMWATLVSFPIMTVWVIGAPTFALVVLYKFRNDLDDWKVKKYLLLIYQGFKPNRFYWEFINTFRKFIIICISVFLSAISAQYRILITLSKIFLLIL
jgi:hypothetical protein